MEVAAKVIASPGWIEAELLEWDVVADGADERAVVQQLEHSIVAEYHLAAAHGRALSYLRRSGATLEGAIWVLLDLPESVRSAMLSA